MPSRRRSALRTLSLIGVIAGFLAVYIGSAAYCIVLSIGQRYAIGIVAGALMLQDREPPGRIAPIMPGLSPIPSVVNPSRQRQPFTHHPVDFYRHNFHFTWWLDARATSVAGSRWIEIPLWMPAAAAALITGGWLLKERFRVPPGHCRFCRYDLRNAAGPLCPECGASVAMARRA